MRDYFPFISEIRFFSNGSWYFIIKNTHQLRDPSKRLKVKILDPSISTRYTELFLINDAFMMKFNDSSYRYRCIKLLNQLSRSFQFFLFFFSRLSFSHESSSYPFRTNFCLAFSFFLFTINSNRILFATKLYLSAQYIQEEFPDGEYGSSIFPFPDVER